MAQRSRKSRRPGDLRDVIKRVRQFYGAFCLWVSVQIAQLVTHVEDDAVTSFDNFPPLARFKFGGRLLFGVWSAQRKARPAIVTCRFQVVCSRVALRLVASGDEKYGNSVRNGFFVETQGSGNCGCLLLVEPIVPVLRDITEVVLQLLIPVGKSRFVNIEYQRQLLARLGSAGPSPQYCDRQVTLPIQVRGIATMVPGAVV